MSRRRLTFSREPVRTTISRRSLLVAGIGTVAGMALAACGGEPEPIRVTPASDGFIPEVVPTPIQIANGNVMGDAPLMIALERGNFSAETLEPDLQLRTSDQELIDLLVQGGTGIVLGELGPAFFNARQSGQDLKVIGPLSLDVPPLSIPLMVARGRFDSGEITSIGDLDGRTIGMARPGFTEYLLDKALASAGLTVDNVTVDINSGKRLHTRLERGLIDAAMIAEPEATEAVINGEAVILNDTYLPEFTATYALTTGEYLAANQEAISAFFRVIYNSCVEMLENGFNSPKNQTIFQLYNGKDAEVLARMSPYGCANTGAVNLNELEDIQQFYLDRQMLELATPTDPASFVDDSLARQAASEIFS